MARRRISTRQLGIAAVTSVAGLGAAAALPAAAQATSWWGWGTPCSPKDNPWVAPGTNCVHYGAHHNSFSMIRGSDYVNGGVCEGFYGGPYSCTPFTYKSGVGHVVNYCVHCNGASGANTDVHNHDPRYSIHDYLWIQGLS
jgi:hypothetical protein